MSPIVTIIVVTWNKKKDVLNLMDALLVLEYDNFRIVVVDNASTDNTAVAVRNHPLDVVLLENQENLGGTGGFNAGLRYALEHLEQDFIWLLDNDAMVTPETLKCLVNAMAVDLSIGVAGSRIMAPEREGLIVELGGTVDWSGATWKPNQRYQLECEEDSEVVVDVDYVAACSALIRESALRQVGIMDERFFLHWDDIDLCLRFKKQGFRVVAVYNSVIFHSVEKGFNPNIVYFDIRNGLLIATKHLSFLKRFSMQWALSRLVGMGCVASVLDRRKGLAKIFLLAFKDALIGNFGGFNPPLKDPPRLYKAITLPTPANKILLITNGSFPNVCSVVEMVKNQWPSCQIDFLVQEDRMNLLTRICSGGAILTFNLRHDGFFRELSLGVCLLTSQYDYAIEVNDDFLFPYTAFQKNVLLAKTDGTFVLKSTGLSGLARLAFVMGCGSILAFMIFLLSVLQGVLHGRK